MALRNIEHFVSFLLCLIGIGTVALLSNSCGASHVRLSKEDQERAYRIEYSATEENVSKWISLWDQRSWIVGLPVNAEGTVKERQKPDAQTIKAAVLNAFSDALSATEWVDASYRLRDEIAVQTRINLSYAPNRKAKRVGIEAADQTEWFANIVLPERSFIWESVLDILLPNQFFATLPKLSQLAFFQFQTLKTMQDFAWVEPNLGAETRQSCVPAGNQGSRPVEWFDANGSCVDEKDNRIRQVFSRINWHLAQDAYDKLLPANPNIRKKEITVAVVDTGIDYEHSKLKDRMFKNPDEEFNGEDDDNNGVIDDVYGFDATVLNGETDTTFKPPGSADVGGAGAPCPAQTAAPGGGTCGHGTHVAGVIAAQQGGLHALGLCDSCKLYSIRAAKKCVYPATTTRGSCVAPKANGQAPEEGSYIANGKIFDWDQIVGLNYLLNFTKKGTDDLNVFIVNMSLGKYVYNRAMAASLSKLYENGVLIVAAAGNDNTETPMFPAAYSSTLSVCATSEDPGYTSVGRTGYGTRGRFAKADFSNFGDWVDVCAPGVDIQSTLPGENIDAWSGTSQASPLVAGAAGFLWSILYETGETNQSIRNRIERFANARALYDPSLSPKNDHYGDTIAGVENYLLGTGLLDIEAALKGEQGGASSSFVETARATGADSQLKSGCVVSAVGTKQWTLLSVMSTMPFVLLQFLMVVSLIRRCRETGFLRQRRSRRAR